MNDDTKPTPPTQDAVGTVPDPGAQADQHWWARLLRWLGFGRSSKRRG